MYDNRNRNPKLQALNISEVHVAEHRHASPEKICGSIPSLFELKPADEQL